MKRYEKKYGYLPKLAESIELSLLEQSFIPVYKPRLITSIYYDSNDFSLYSDSIHGYGIRKKLRSRFYNLENNCILENKMRAYDTGFKLHEKQIIVSQFKYQVFYSDNFFCNNANLLIPDSLNIIYRPKVVITYFRKYFVHSIKPDLRITLDSEIRYGRVSELDLSNKSFYAEISALASRNVLEIKFSSNNEQCSSVGIASFANINLVNERHSKYCNAVEALF